MRRFCRSVYLRGHGKERQNDDGKKEREGFHLKYYREGADVWKAVCNYQDLYFLNCGNHRGTASRYKRYSFLKRSSNAGSSKNITQK